MLRCTLPRKVTPKLLSRRDLPIDTIALAKFLIGRSIISEASEGTVVARITETEAYLPGDAAAHSFRGKTLRNASLFLERGHAYVYFIYGNHFCLNVSSETEGAGAGVLLRAAELLSGLKLVRSRRGDVPDRDLLRGPGRLAAALGVTRAHDGIDLTKRGALWLGAEMSTVASIGETVRIGITKDAERVLRFYERDNEYVSGPRHLR